MSRKTKDMTFSEQQHYYDIFINHNRDYEFMWAHYRIHPNTMRAIARNVLGEFTKGKDKEFRRIFKK